MRILFLISFLLFSGVTSLRFALVLFSSLVWTCIAILLCPNISRITSAMACKFICFYCNINRNLRTLFAFSNILSSLSLGNRLIASGLNGYSHFFHDFFISYQLLLAMKVIWWKEISSSFRSFWIWNSATLSLEPPTISLLMWM